MSVKSLLLATVFLCIPAVVLADPADEARRQAQMQRLRDTAAANDRRNADAAFQQNLERSRSSTSNGQPSSNIASSNIESGTSGGSSSLPGGRANDSAYGNGPAEEGYDPATGKITINVSGGGGVAAALSALAAADTQNLAQTAQRLSREAAAGNVQSQYQLGRMYAAGNGLSADEIAARRLFVAAADQGHVEASASAGQYLVYGKGGPVDMASGLRYAETAAQAGNIDAKSMLGVRYMATAFETGDNANMPRAVQYLEQAAEAGNELAQEALGSSIYFYGVGGVAPDMAKAVKYMRMGIEQGNPESMSDLGTLMVFGEAAAGGSRAEGWALISRAAQAGNGRAMWRLGQAKTNGEEGLAKDLPEGLRFARLSAQTGEVNGIFLLAMLTYHGLGLPADKVEGTRLFRQAAEAGSGEAQHEMGLTYYHGDVGIEKDLTEAARWARMSADSGAAVGELLYGKLLWAGEGVAQDRIAAVQFFKKAADQGNATAISDLTDPEVAAILVSLGN